MKTIEKREPNNNHLIQQIRSIKPFAIFDLARTIAESSLAQGSVYTESRATTEEEKKRSFYIKMERAKLDSEVIILPNGRVAPANSLFINANVKEGVENIKQLLERSERELPTFVYFLAKFMISTVSHLGNKQQAYHRPGGPTTMGLVGETTIPLEVREPWPIEDVMESLEAEDFFKKSQVKTLTVHFTCLGHYLATIGPFNRDLLTDLIPQSNFYTGRSEKPEEYALFGRLLSARLGDQVLRETQ